MSLAGPARGQTLADWVRELSSPDQFGGAPATPPLLDIADANYGTNLLRNGDFESWSGGASAAPDGWTLFGTGATVARNTTNVQSSLASVDLLNTLNNTAELSQALDISSTENTRLRGKKVTFSIKCKVSTAERVTIKVDDGVDSTRSVYHGGDGQFRNMVVSHIIDSSATMIEVSMLIESGSAITATFDAAILVEGETPVEFSPHRSDDFLLPAKGTAITNATSATPPDYADLDSMTFSNIILNDEQSVELIFSGYCSHDTLNASIDLKFVRDSTDIGVTQALGFTRTSFVFPVAFAFLDRKPGKGTYTYKVQWKTDSGVATFSNRTLLLKVLPDI